VKEEHDEKREKIRIIDMVLNCCAKTDKTLKQGIDKEEGELILALAVEVG